MKKIIVLILVASIATTLFSIIDSTLTIDSLLMQSLRDNLNQSTSSDPLIYAYLSELRNDEENLMDSSKVISFNHDLVNYSKLAFYKAIKYHDPDFYPGIINSLIRGITGDVTSDNYIYIRPQTMSSPDQFVDGENPGSIVQLIYNTDNNYSYCDRLPFSTDPAQGFVSSNLDNYNRVYYASNGLTFVSFIYDMLYWEMTDHQKAAARENIEILSGYLYNYLKRPDLIGMTPWSTFYSPFWANSNENGLIDWTDGNDKINILGARPLETLCALGYSRLVLGYLPDNDEILEWVINMLTTEPIQEDFYGVLSYIVKKSGAHVNGYDYASQAFEGPPQIFFTALNRLTDTNLWDNQYVAKWMNSIVNNLNPNYYTVPIEDGWWKLGGRDYGWLDRGLAEYYYQNSTDIVGKNKIKWFIHRQKAALGSWPSTKPLHYIINFPVVYAYNPSCPITDDDYQPISSLSGIYSNQEYTHLSPPLQMGQDYETQAYKNRLWLHVNHENSYEEENFHPSQEKGHYRVYYDNKQFIIDPGYRACFSDAMGGWWRTLRWCRSIYSKNMLVVDPDEENESSHVQQQYSTAPLPSDPIDLKLKRPLSGSLWALYTGNENLVDKCKREYLFTNKDIRHLQVRIDYNDLTPDHAGNVSYTSPVNIIDARLYRNFYTFGNDGILVYDKIASLDEQSYTYRNQLHFNPSAVMNYNPTTGVFSATMGSSRLYGTMGALATSSTKRIDGLKEGNTIDDTLFPNGLPTGDADILISASNIVSRAHSRIRVDTGSSTGSSFLTLLIPSTSGTNPITSIVDSSNVYLAYANIDPNNQIYTGVSNQSQSMINGLRFSTDADLFYIRSNNDFSNIKSMIINNGNELTIRDCRIPGFGEIELFHGYASDIEEYISEWYNNQLFMTINSAQSQYPRFKIIRNGISPENFSAKLLYPSYMDETAVIVTDEPISRGCITNVIQSLAYDDQYFYVNYTWDDLSAAGLVDDNLVIVKATIPELNLNTDLNIQGVVSIIGSITINNGASMEIYPNSSVTISEDVYISNHGTLTIDGGTSRSISLNKANQPWSGITTYRDGNLICNNAIIEGAQTGISVRGNSSITHSEITNCYKGIAIETGTTFTIMWNTINNNTYGLVISNNQATISNGIVAHNVVTQNSVGVLLYNSNTKLASNTILYNTRTGIHLIRESDSIITDSNISYTEYNGLSRPEIILESDSYPIIDDARNDINADGLGYSLYYVSTSEIEKMLARNNYWGTTDSHQIRDSIYPPWWDVVYEPFCLEPNTYIPYLEDNLFKQALQAEESGELDTAKQLYTSIVLTEPDSLYALQSLGRLNSLYSESPNSLIELRNIYSVYAQSCNDSLLVASAQVRSIMLDRFDMQYLQAIQGYEELLETSTTELDSLLCLLDIAYTLQEMYYNDQGKGTHTSFPYHANGIQVSSLKEANLTVDRIWSEIMRISDNTTILNVPVPTQLDVTNYPNPFNPTTTIAFSLPEEGVVRLSVYNIRGQLVKELINESMTRGFHKVVWDGRDNRNRSVSSGLYFIRIEVGNTSKVKKIMMLK